MRFNQAALAHGAVRHRLLAQRRAVLPLREVQSSSWGLAVPVVTGWASLHHHGHAITGAAAALTDRYMFKIRALKPTSSSCPCRLARLALMSHTSVRSMGTDAATMVRAI